MAVSFPFAGARPPDARLSIIYLIYLQSMTDRAGGDGARLAALFHHRWAGATLTELHRSRGAKFVTLLHRLGAGRGTLQRTLDTLAGLRLVRRNPGYGHPMRPEWVVTAAGARLAPACGELLRRVRRLGVQEVAGRKWAFPVVLALDGGLDRFSLIESSIPGVTARALAMTLREMEGAGVVERRVEDAHPPRVRYRLAPSARHLVPPLLRLARETAATVR